MVDEIRLLYLTVPLGKEPWQVQLMWKNYHLNMVSTHQKFTFPRQVQHNRSSLADPRSDSGFARYSNICGTLYQNPNLYSKFQMLRWNILQHCGPASGPYKSLINADVLLGLVISREHCVRILNLYMLSGLPKGNKKDVKQSIHL